MSNNRQQNQRKNEDPNRRRQPPSSNFNQRSNRSVVVGGPQEGGFDTSAWGNYTNYYPVQNVNSNLQTGGYEQRPRSNQNRPRPPSSAAKTAATSTPASSLMCDNFLSEEQVLRDIAEKKTIRGFLRINPKQYTDAFITDPEGGSDFFIDNVRERNRALHSDEVAAEIKPKRQWKIIPEFSDLVTAVIRGTDQNVTTANEPVATTQMKHDVKRETLATFDAEHIPITDEMIGKIPDAYFQRTARVVYIFRRRHTMKASGFLRKMPDNNRNFALFSPMDNRIPRLMIPMNNCPPDFQEKPSLYEKSIFLARIVDIPGDKKFARGELIEQIGDADTLEGQSKAILLEADINDEEFSDDVIKCLPLENDRWKIPDEEYTKRLDLRNQCIFTIDPSTARDLDDALSCEKLHDGLFRVGVHIADVSYFIPEQSALDVEASKRTTSVYLVERVIPMLPRLLCDRLCSLNPDEDRLTYSVIWTMNDAGEIVDEQFTRSIIRSCVKLSYDVAQSIIEKPNETFNETQLPNISAPFKVEDVQRSILHLQHIAKQLRSKRPGALSLNQPKLQFQVNLNDRRPISFSTYSQADSHRLVEEFMLLANERVAKKLLSTESISEKIILRRHPPPNPTVLQGVAKLLTTHGINLSGSSSQELSSVIRSIDDESKKRLIIHMLAKSMQLATYCCASCVADGDFSHFALNIDAYTHFTSPIRRYPDVLVHRLLGAALDYNENLVETPRKLHEIAQLCNEKKMNAKACSEKSTELHLAFLLKDCGPVSDQAIIVGVKDQSLDIYLFHIGVALRAGINNLPLDHPRTNFQTNQLTIFWKVENPPSTLKQVLCPFQIVYVDLSSEFDLNTKKFKLIATLRHPNAEKVTNLIDLCPTTDVSTTAILNQQLDFDPYAEY